MTGILSIFDSVAAGRLFICVTAMVFSINHAALAKPPDTAVNEWCPVMPDEKVDPKITTVHRGKTVGLCCDTCLKKFLANPAKYEGKLPQFAMLSTSVPGGLDGSPGHDHSSADIGGEQREPLLGRLHPILVHFPIAGIPLAFLGFLVCLTTGREGFARADVPPLFVATATAIASVVTGNIAHDAMRFSESLQVVVERHQFVSTTVMVIAICLSILRLWRWNRLSGIWRCVYGVGLLIACVLLGLTGYLGGSLVYGSDHLAW